MRRTRGAKQNRIAYFERDDIKDAIQPVGDYWIEGDTLKISVILIKNNKRESESITVTGKVDEPEKVIEKLVQEIIK